MTPRRATAAPTPPDGTSAWGVSRNIRGYVIGPFGARSFLRPRRRPRRPSNAAFSGLQSAESAVHSTFSSVQSTFSAMQSTFSAVQSTFSAVQAAHSAMQSTFSAVQSARSAVSSTCSAVQPPQRPPRSAGSPVQWARSAVLSARSAVQPARTGVGQPARRAVRPAVIWHPRPLERIGGQSSSGEMSSAYSCASQTLRRQTGVVSCTA